VAMRGDHFLRNGRRRGDTKPDHVDASGRHPRLGVQLRCTPMAGCDDSLSRQPPNAPERTDSVGRRPVVCDDDRNAHPDAAELGHDGGRGFVGVDQFNSVPCEK
jgi:hypothetical protein